MSATIGGAPFAGTALPGPLRVVTHDGSNLRVTQYCGGIQVTGWMPRPDDRRGDNSCAPRTIEPEYPHTPAAERRPLPPGYVAMSDDPALRNPLGHLVRRGGSIHWLVPHDDGFKCVGWQVVPVAKSPKSKGGAVLRRVYIEDGHRNVVTFGLGYSPRSVAPSFLELDGPSWQGDGGEGVGLCDQLYSIVGVDREHVSLIQGEYLAGLSSDFTPTTRKTGTSRAPLVRLAPPISRRSRSRASGPFIMAAEPRIARGEVGATIPGHGAAHRLAHVRALRRPPGDRAWRGAPALRLLRGAIPSRRERPRAGRVRSLAGRHAGPRRSCPAGNGSRGSPWG